MALTRASSRGLRYPQRHRPDRVAGFLSRPGSLAGTPRRQRRAGDRDRAVRTPVSHAAAVGIHCRGWDHFDQRARSIRPRDWSGTHRCCRRIPCAGVWFTCTTHHWPHHRRPNRANRPRRPHRRPSRQPPSFRATLNKPGRLLSSSTPRVSSRPRGGVQGCERIAPKPSVGRAHVQLAATRAATNPCLHSGAGTTVPGSQDIQCPGDRPRTSDLPGDHAPKK